MTARLYEASVPVFRHALGVLSTLLEIGERHARDHAMNPDALMDLRLAPDMLSLIGQVQRASDHAKGGAARLCGLDPPAWSDTETGIAEAYTRIDRTLDYLGNLPEAAFNDAPERVVRTRFEIPALSAPRYLHGFALPSFFFHVSMAYAILRHHGVRLGKRDFIGSLENP